MAVYGDYQGSEEVDLLPMTTYRIITQSLSGAVVVENDTIFQTAPFLSEWVGKLWFDFRDYCQGKGWTIQPIDEVYRPQWIECGKEAYQLSWNGDALTRVILHKDGEVTELRYAEMPEWIRRLL